MNTEWVLEIVRENPVLGPVVFVLIQILQTVVAPIPGGVTGPVGGYLFGWAGILWTMVGSGVGATVVFLLSRKFGKKLILKFVKDEEFFRFEKLLSGKAEGVFFLLFLIPGLPDDTICYVAGLSKIPVGRLVLSYMLGRLPAVVVGNYLGMGMAEGDAWKVGVTAGVIVVAVAIVGWQRERIVGLIQRGRFNKREKYDIIPGMSRKKKVAVAKLNRNNNHKHSQKRQHLRHKDGR